MDGVTTVMLAQMTIKITKEQEAWIKEQVKNELYADHDEYMRALIRRAYLENKEQKEFQAWRELQELRITNGF